MAQNPFLPIKFIPQAGMSSDTDPRFRYGGMYGTDTKNIQFLTQGGATTPSIEPTLGNIYAYTLPSVVAQNKVFRVYMDAIDNASTYTLTMSNGNSVVIGVATWNGILNGPLTMANNAIAAILAAVNPVLIAWGIPVQTSTTAGYFDFQFFGGTAVDYWDYSISLTSTNATPTLPIVVQEAIDVSLVGDMVQIGSYDLAGDLFLWSTTQHELPSELSITNISNNGAGVIRVTVPNHGLVTGERVVIKASIASANGQWIVNVIDANNFDLQGSAFVANATTGIVVINPSGIGEVGVAQRDDNSQTWTYTRLLRTKEFNFVTKKQPKTYCERNNIFASLYWTDNYNVPRVMYYTGAYVANGALSYIDPLGQYSYGSIAQETIMVIGSAFIDFSFSAQSQTGGALPSGNWRYAIRFLTENLNPTNWTDLIQPVPVFRATTNQSLANAEVLFGDNEGVTTSKINNFTLNGITPYLFKYVELAGVNYLDSGQAGLIIRRDLLTQNTLQTLQHTGLETGNQTLDVAELLGENISVKTALNIDAVNNRLVLSNLTTQQRTDFGDWLKTFNHNVKRTESANGNTIITIKNAIDGTLRVGEFQEPSNVYGRAGYMMNEVYRISGKLELLDGGFTDCFWIDDVVINSSAINTGNPFGDNRRIAGLPSMDLTDFNSDVVYSPYIEFVNINWGFLVDGSPVSDIVRRIHIQRVEMDDTNIEVLASGIIIQSTNNTPGPGFVQVQDSGGSVYSATASADYVPSPPSGIEEGFSDYIHATGARFDNPVANPTVLNPIYPSFAVNNLAEAQQMGSFYSPDIMFGLKAWSFLPGDQLLIRGCPTTTDFGGFTASIMGNVPIASNVFYNTIRDFSGFTGTPDVSYTVSDQKNMNAGDNTLISGTTLNARYYKFNRYVIFFNFGAVYESQIQYPTSPVYCVSTSIPPSGAGLNFGVQMAQVYVPKTNKFGDINSSNYIPTGAIVNAGDPDVSVFGGDCFTQKTWMKHRNCVSFDKNNDSTTTFTVLGYGGGCGFYSQNRVNSQMINREDSGLAWKYTDIDQFVWMNTVDANPFGIVYNNGYNIRNGISADISFDSNLKSSNFLSARIIWSDMKPENSIVDNYRSFLPLNFKDLQLSFGPIQEHKNVNSQLMSWQNNHYELQYFDSTGLLVTNSLEAVLGNAGVMAQRGNALSTYGTSHGFSVIKGKTGSGKDTVAWIDTVHGKIVKHDPSQGTSVISDVEQMRWFANNYTRYAGLYDTPADGAGIHGVFDHQNNEFIWTVRAKKTGVQQWVNVNNYNQGDVVEATAIDFHLLQTFYRCLITNQGLDPSTNPTYWEAIPFTEYEYYNVFTLAYNEVKNKFTTFYSYLPKIFSTRGKLFLSPSPVNDESQAYEHLRGDYCTWYTQGNLELTDRWRIGGMSINHDINLSKHFLNIMFQSKLAPTRIEVNTSEYSTYMQDIDCEKRFDQWVVSIKNNLDAQGRPDQDTSFLLDTWASVSIEGLPKVYTNFFDFIMRARYISRTYQT